MKFKLNYVTWKIIELETKELKDRFDDEAGYLYGYCDYVGNVIYLNNALCHDRKRNVLFHELVHCWTMSSGWGFSSNLDIEDICNIVACSNDFITEVTNKYFSRKDKK